MSKTCGIYCGGRAFWAYDESLSILLRFIAKEAEESNDSEFHPDEIEQWRVVAILGSDVGLHIGDGWTAEHTDRFNSLVQRCSEQLRTVGRLSGEEVLGWSVHGDRRVIWRGEPTDVRSTDPIVSLAGAIVRLVRGQLEVPPPGHWWTFGFGAEPDLIEMRHNPGGVTG